MFQKDRYQQISSLTVLLPTNSLAPNASFIKNQKQKH